MPMDEEGFCAFYEQTARKLRSYLRSVLRDDVTLVDDILQESYLRLLKADLPIGMDAAWRKNYLYRVAINLVRDHRRSRQTAPLPVEREYAARENSFDETRDIKQIFGRLKPRERDLLWLAYVECFSHSEIAALLEANTASIRPMLARARASFGARLKKRGYGA
jgi:RNA polymerase sigma-70 factor, ECF subfamily